MNAETSAMTNLADEIAAAIPVRAWKRYRYEGIAFFCLLLPFAVANGMVISSALSMPVYCAKIVLFCLPVAYLSFQIWKRWYLIRLITLFLALLAGGEAYIAFQFGGASGSSVFSILATSDSSEAIGYLGQRLIAICAWLALCLLSHVTAIYYARRSVIRTDPFFVLCLLCLAAYATYLGALSAETYLKEKNANRYPRTSQHADEKLFGVAYLSPVLSTIKDTFPFGLPIRLWVFAQEENSMREMERKLHTHQFHATTSLPSDQILTVVLVLGETARYDRWSVNGYQRNTSPNMLRLQAQSELISMRNMITPRSFTMGSIPIYLSGRDIMAEGITQKSLISAFNEAGFKTYFLSTQVRKGFLNNVTSLFANEAGQQAYYETDETSGKLFDAHLIEPLEAILTHDGNKKLIVMHTMGSHALYQARYPKSFEKYPVSDDGYDSVSNAFDNTIYYTDHVLAEVVASLASRPGAALMIYGSDHGESLPTPSCKFIGHGALNHENLHIPYFVWANKNYRQNQQKKWQSLLANQNKATMTMSNFATLLDLADISYPGMPVQESLARDYSEMAERKVLDMQNHAIDFNRAVKKDQACGLLEAPAVHTPRPVAAVP